MQINTCLYLAKGMAEYVLILELEDFFIPRGSNLNFKNVMEAFQPENQRRNENHSRRKSLSLSFNGSQKKNENENKNENESVFTCKRNETGLQGRENSDLVYGRDQAHPHCYINVPTEIASHSNQKSRKSLENPWIGQR